MNPVVSYDPATPQQQHPWGHITWQVTGKSSVIASMTIGRVCIDAGDAEYELGPGDTISIPAGVYHHARNPGDEPADMIVCFSSGDRDFELEAR